MESKSSRLCVSWLTLTAVVLMFRLADSQIFPMPRSAGGQLIGNCTSESLIAALGTTGSELAREDSLLSQALTTGDANLNEGPFVRIIQSLIVCTAAGRQRDTIGSISVIVMYACGGPFCGGGGSTVENEMRTDQVQFDCTEDNDWEARFVEAGQTRSPLALDEEDGAPFFLTERDDMCGLCSSTISDADHCDACHADCNVGMQRCIGTDADQCCNFYYNDVCVIECPGQLVGGDAPSFDCGCATLELDNGNIVRSDGNQVGSVATHTCNRNDGFVLRGVSSDVENVDRTCSEENGWSGSAIMCDMFVCAAGDLSLENGNIDFSSSTVGSVASFNCFSGFELMGTRTRTCQIGGWTGENPTCVQPTEPTLGTPSAGGQSCDVGCIIGIVLAVLGAIILASVIAGVAYAIYSYKNHPDTKFAKYDADNINGVARDNPLYVDPDAVVGDGAEAA